jgi:glycosyltransferase involved in cell wall biosynthesis
VVSTTLPGVSEAITDDVSGLLVEPEDPQALAGALERVLADPELRARLGVAARETAAARFDRTANLPSVMEALASAGIIPAEAAA